MAAAGVPWWSLPTSGSALSASLVGGLGSKHVIYALEGLGAGRRV